MLFHKYVKFSVREYPSDCLICAIRPSLNFNKLHTFNADYYCCHSRISSNPQFKASRTFQILSLTYCLVIIAGIVKDVIKLRKRLDAEDLFTMIRISNSVSIAYSQMYYIMLIKIKLKTWNAKLSLINNRRSFGLKNMLTKSDVKRINNRIFYFVAFASSLELLNFLPLIFLETVNLELLMDIVTSEFATFGFLCILVHVGQSSEVFGTLFFNCITRIEICLSADQHEYPFEERLYNNKTTNLEKIQKMQRLYMALWKCFKFSEVQFPADAMMTYLLDSMVLVLLESYVFVLYFRGRLLLNIFDWQILWKSLLIIFGCLLCCIHMNRVLALVDDRLSSLFKIPISKLNRIEATQFEMFIRTIVERKPKLQISEIFVWGPSLILAVLATGITYMLVALQFRFFW